MFNPNCNSINSVTYLLVQTWVCDLVNAGMSHSRISDRLKLSPSTIQKVSTKKRFPRIKTVFALGSYNLKIFDTTKLYGVAVENYAWLIQSG